MLRWAGVVIGVAALVGLVLVVLPTGSNQPRPEPRILAPGDAGGAAPGSFVIHDAPPPAAPPPAVPTTGLPAPVPPGSAALPSAADGTDLDAVMQRLRAASQTPPGSPPAPGAPPVITPATPDAAAPPPATPPDQAAVPPPAAPRWSSVTGQGTRWRMTRSSDGFVITIDLGGGQTADVHVQPAFGALDPASVNVRVDYLHDAILQNFPRTSASYTFARDGSISLNH